MNTIVEVELSADPMTVYFKEMKKGEQRLHKVLLKNTSQNALNISSIDVSDDMIKVDLINNSPNWPIELKSNTSMELLVSFRFATDSARFSNQIKINYSGGEANEAFLRVYATKEQPPKEPEKQMETQPKDLKGPQKDAQPVPLTPKPPVKKIIQAPAEVPPESESNNRLGQDLLSQKGGNFDGRR